MRTSPVLSRTPSRRIIAVLLLAAVVSAACLPGPVVREGTACTGSGLGHDSVNVLKCTSGRWTVYKSITQYEADEAAAAKKTQRVLAFRGTSGWVDVYDWSPTFIHSRNPSGSPAFAISRVDEMHKEGIDAVYIQVARAELPDPILDRDLLLKIIARAHSLKMRVIGWYLPTFADIAVEKAHIAAATSIGLDGFGLDIEATAVELATRNQRLIELSTWTRTTYPNLPLAAIVLPPVVTDVINTNYWPSFPWTKIAPSYDVWMPMGYWTNRTTDSGYRDGYRYTIENIDRIRAHINQPTAAVHPIGGLSDTTTMDDVDRFVWAAKERKSIGAGLYDDQISTAEQYSHLAPLRSP